MKDLLGVSRALPWMDESELKQKSLFRSVLVFQFAVITPIIENDFLSISYPLYAEN